MRIYDLIGKVELFVARVSMALMVALIFVASVARFIGKPINWAVDMTTFLFAWACFLSADVAWRTDRLMSVDVFLAKFSEKTKKHIRLLNYFIITVFLVYLVYFGLLLSYTTRARTFQGIPGFSYTWVTLSVPIGALLMLMTTLLKIKREFGK